VAQPAAAQRAAVQRGPFAHALDAVAAASVRRPGGAVVGDPHPEVRLVVGDGDRRVAGRGVAQGIGQRLLDDAVRVPT